MAGLKCLLQVPAVLPAPAVALSRLLPTKPQPFPCREAALVSHAQLPPPGRHQEQGATLLQLSMRQRFGQSSLNIGLHFCRPVRLTREVMIMILNNN